MSSCMIAEYGHITYRFTALMHVFEKPLASNSLRLMIGFRVHTYYVGECSL